jgi:hypothetical protein
MEKQIGAYAFIVGVILAIILGLFGTYIPEYVEYITYLMIILGVIVGFLNIGEKQAFNFLIAAIALLAVGGAGLEMLPTIGNIIGGILTQIAVFVAPAAVIIALKAIWGLGYKKL